jgi:hypothetical protein
MQTRRYTHSQAQIALASAILIAIFPVVALSQSFTTVDPDNFTTIHFPGSVTTGGPGTRLGINLDGNTVGRDKNPDGRFHGFLFSEGEFTSCLANVPNKRRVS